MLTSRNSIRILDKIVRQYEKFNKTPRIKQFFEATKTANKILGLSKEPQENISNCHVRPISRLMALRYISDTVSAPDFDRRWSSTAYGRGRGNGHQFTRHGYAFPNE